MIEGLFHQAVAEWPRAIEVRRSLFEFFPDNLEYGLALADTQARAERPADALETVGRLRKLPAPTAEDPRIDIAEIEARERRGEYALILEVATRALSKGEKRGARRVVAVAYQKEADAYNNLAQYDAALAAAVRAQSLWVELGDRIGEAFALNTIATVLRRKGDRVGAAEARSKVIEAVRAGGSRSNLAAALVNDGIALIEAGQLDKAAQRADEVRSLGRDFTNWRSSVGVADLIRGITQLLRGRLREAGVQMDEAIALFRESGEQRLLAWGLCRRGEVDLALGQLAAAKVALEESLRLREELGLRLYAAESRVTLARLALAEGRAKDAEALGAAALAIYEKATNSDGQAVALAVRAVALRDLGRGDDALAVIARARPLVAKSGDPLVRLAVSVASGRIAGESKDRASAMKELAEAAADGIRWGYAEQQLAARLTLGRLELRTDRRAGRRRLSEVRKEASAMGFELLARQAAL